ncbi:hypothetical protein HOA59_01635 [archaeon]|jgi:Zn-dependent protease|nr:hypothetical protein [archaeon]MBT6824117.1 hypothetical protein [archaeon]MBT7107038.1 hypothetical protein [archaeon]
MLKNKFFKKTEIKHMFISTLIIGFIFSYNNFTIVNWLRLTILAALALIIGESIRKIIAKRKGCETEYQLWQIKKYGITKSAKFPIKIFNKRIKSLYIGIVLPLITIFLSIGHIKFMIIGTSQAKEIILKRVGKKYAKITEFETAIIALAGPLTYILLALVFKALSLPGFEQFIEMTYLLALYSMIPLSKLDGAKIFFGSLPLYIFSAIFIIVSTVLINSPDITLMSTIFLALLTSITIFIGYIYKTNS